MAEVTPGSVGVYPESAELRASGGIAKMMVDVDSRLVEEGSLYLGYAVDTSVASETSFIVEFDNTGLATSSTAYAAMQIASDQPMTITISSIDGHTPSTDTYSLVNMNGFAAHGTAGLVLRAAPTTSTDTEVFVKTDLFSLTVPQALGSWNLGNLYPNGKLGLAAGSAYQLTVANGGTAAGYASVAVTVQEK